MIMNEETMIGLMDKVESMQTLMGMHELAAIDIHNAAVHSRFTPDEGSTAELQASADCDGARVAALGEAVSGGLAELHAKMNDEINDKQASQRVNKALNEILRVFCDSAVKPLDEKGQFDADTAFSLVSEQVSLIADELDIEPELDQEASKIEELRGHK
jgi:hypothetical protein